MIKLAQIIENMNPFYKDYGNYLFGANVNLYGKSIEKDTEEEIYIQQLLGRWLASEDLPEIIPVFEKLYQAKKYYPYILDPGNIHVYKGTHIFKEINLENWVKTNNFIKYKDNLLISENYYNYEPLFKAQSWTTDKEIALWFADLNETENIIMMTHTSKSKFIFKPFILYNLEEKYLLEYMSKLVSKTAIGEKEIIGLGNHKVKLIINKELK